MIGGERMEKTIAIEFTEDELKLIQFFICNRLEDYSSNQYMKFLNTLEGDTHVGLKVLDALALLKARRD